MSCKKKIMKIFSDRKQSGQGLWIDNKKTSMYKIEKEANLFHNPSI